MHLIGMLTDADVRRFASTVQGQGTDAENRAAMAGSGGFQHVVPPVGRSGVELVQELLEVSVRVDGP